METTERLSGDPQRAAALWRLKDAPRSTWVLESTDAADAEALFQLICQSLLLEEGDTEPKMNLLAFYEEGRWVNFIFPRSKHRPTCYTAKGTDNLLCSPASVDRRSFILPQEKDFLKITPDDIARIYRKYAWHLPPCNRRKRASASWQNPR